MAKRMRLPNGFGQISEIKKRRLRNKFRAMVTEGWTDEGKPIRKVVGYFRTYNDAYQALVKYNENPYHAEMDMLELYERWSEKKYPTIVNPSGYKSAWNYCDSIYHIMVCNLRTRDINNLLESDMPPSRRRTIKVMLCMMLDFAVEYELTDKNYAKLSSASTYVKTQNGHVPFTEDELNILWKNWDDDVVDLILFGCYTGFRPREILSIRNENINTDSDIWIITGGMKTAAGTNRQIPVHDRIKPIVERGLNFNSNYLFKQFSYESYKHHFKKMREKLNLDTAHRPHDTRTTFVTRLKEAEADEYAIKRLVGHAIKDVTESVYTKRSMEWLKGELMRMS